MSGEGQVGGVRGVEGGAGQQLLGQGGEQPRLVAGHGPSGVLDETAVGVVPSEHDHQVGCLLDLQTGAQVAQFRDSGHDPTLSAAPVGRGRGDSIC